MPNKPARYQRNQRNNPYATDDLMVRLHHTAAGLAWRWRTELTLLTLTAAAIWRLALLITIIWAAVVVAAFITILLAVPATRRFTARRFWCVLVRHRIQRLCYEARLHTRSGRIPLVLWIRPTKVGERAWVLCRAGICVEDFQAHLGELRAACFARDASAVHNPRWSHLVTIDIARRNPLGPHNIIRSPLTAIRREPPPAQEGEAA